MIERADIEDVVRALQERHGCHTAILYGSYARGDAEGARLLRRLDEVFERGAEPLHEDEISARRQWAWKMLERATRSDIEGNFRRVHAPDMHTALEAALEPGASLTELEAAVALAAGPRTSLSPALI